MWLTLATLLLKIVAAIIRERSDEQLKQIGRNEAFLQTLVQIAENTQIARRVELDVGKLGRDGIDDILRKYYRDDDGESSG